MKRFALLIVPFLSLSCQREGPIFPEETPPATSGVYVVNEGRFNKNEASLTFYAPDSDKVYQDVFAAVNGRKLGDVGNDMVLYSGKGFIVVNNSQKIEAIRLDDNKSIGTVTLFGSPYKMAIYTDLKGYVTNLYDNSVTVFNPLTYTIIKSRIPVGLNPEGIAIARNKIYVCNSGFGEDSTISIIDPARDSVMKTISVGRSPSEIGIEGRGWLVVKCDGRSDFLDPSKDTPGSLVFLNPGGDSVVSTIDIPLAIFGHPGKLAVTTKGYGYLKVNNGIMKFDTRTGEILASSFITTGQMVVNGLAVDESTEYVYVANANDYVNDGAVLIYDKNGQQLRSFKAGIIPGTVVFKK